MYQVRSAALIDIINDLRGILFLFDCNIKQIAINAGISGKQMVAIKNDFFERDSKTPAA